MAKVDEALGGLLIASLTSRSCWQLYEFDEHRTFKLNRCSGEVLYLSGGQREQIREPD